MLTSNAPLTPREREVIQYAVQGLKNREIAVQMKIAKRTVEHYRRSAMLKLGTKTAIQTGYDFAQKELVE